MKWIKSYTLYEAKTKDTTDWGKLCRDLVDGYYSLVDKENDLSELVEDVKDVCLDLSEFYQSPSVGFSIYFDDDKLKSRTRRSRSISIPSSGRIKYIHHQKALRLPIIKGVTYSHWKEISTILKMVLESDLKTARFGVSLNFNNPGGYDVKRLKKTIIKRLKDIKWGLESRGWIINQKGNGVDYQFYGSQLHFDIIRPITVNLANEWLSSVGLQYINPPSSIVESNDDIDVISDISDILLEWSDSGNGVKVDWVDSRYKRELVIILNNRLGNLDLDTFLRLFNYMKDLGYKCNWIYCEDSGGSDKVYILQYATDFGLGMEINNLNSWKHLQLVFYK